MTIAAHICPIIKASIPNAKSKIMLAKSFDSCLFFIRLGVYDSHTGKKKKKGKYLTLNMILTGANQMIGNFLCNPLCR